MIRHMGLQEKYYNFIVNGSKTFEGRLGSDKNKALQLGDVIVFNDSLKVRIISVHIFPSYEDVMKVLDFKKLIPDAKSVEDAIGVYEEFYSKEKQANLGVYVFGIELI